MCFFAKLCYNFCEEMIMKNSDGISKAISYRIKSLCYEKKLPINQLALNCYLTQSTV